MILEFGAGLSERPILRQARSEELLLDGGTRVRVWLKVPPFSDSGLLHKDRKEKASEYNLTKLCKYLCPSLDITVITKEDGKSFCAITASDWLTCSASELWERIDHGYEGTGNRKKRFNEFIEHGYHNLTLLKDAKDQVLGRACLMGGYDNSGVVTVGGLRSCNLSHIVGILKGTVMRAGRDDALPLVDHNVLAAWAIDQSILISRLRSDPRYKMECAQLVWICNGKTGPLPIAQNQGLWVTYDDITNMDNLPEVLLLFSIYQYEGILRHFKNIDFEPNVFISEVSGAPVILQSQGYSDWPSVERIWGDNEFYYRRTLAGAIIEATAKSWGVPLESILEVCVHRRESKYAVAKSEGQIIKEDVIIIRKPNSGKNK